MADHAMVVQLTLFSIATRWQRMVGVLNMGKAKAAGGTATVNVVFPKALIQQMDAYTESFMESHPDMILRRSDVVRIAVGEFIRANGNGANGKAGRK
jgi:hypothetical protein